MQTNLIEVSSSSGRIQNAKFQLLIRANNKNGSSREWEAFFVKLIRVKHAKLHRNLFGRVSNDWVRNGSPRSVCLNVANPSLVCISLYEVELNY